MSFMNKMREMVKGYENYEDNIGWTRNEDFNYQMAQALIAVDDVLDSGDTLISISDLYEAMEQTNGDDDVK